MARWYILVAGLSHPFHRPGYHGLEDGDKSVGNRDMGRIRAWLSGETKAAARPTVSRTVVVQIAAGWN